MSRGEERSLITGWGIIDPTNELCDRIHYFHFCSHPWLLDPFLVGGDLMLQVIVILFWWCELTCYRCDFMESCHSVTDLQIQPLARRWGDKDEGTDSDVRLHSALPF